MAKTKELTEKDDVKKKKQTIKIIIDGFEKLGWKYDYDKDADSFKTGFTCTNVSVITGIHVGDVSVCYMCEMDFTVKKRDYPMILREINQINNDLFCGRFFLDPDSGRIYFSYSILNFVCEIHPAFGAAFIKLMADLIDEYGGRLKEVLASVAAD